MRVCCGVRGSTENVCQFISSRFAARKPPSSGATHTWGDYIFYLSLLGSIFPANSRLGCNQPRKNPPYTPFRVCCVRESTTVTPLCKHADPSPLTLWHNKIQHNKIHCRPSRNICQYLGIYRPFGQCVLGMCIPCGPSHEPTSFKSGGKKTGHAES